MSRTLEKLFMAVNISIILLHVLSNRAVAISVHNDTEHSLINIKEQLQIHLGNDYVVSSSLETTCPEGWICENSEIILLSITKGYVSKLNIYIVPLTWVGLDILNKYGKVVSAWKGDYRYLIIGNDKTSVGKVIEILKLERFNVFDSLSEDCSSCEAHRQGRGHGRRDWCSIITGKSRTDITNKIAVITNRCRSIFGDNCNFMTYFNSCTTMIYPCENIYLRAIDQPIDERIVKRALIALGTICNSDIAKSIYNANIENLFSINDRLYEMASSIFSKCIGRSELLNIIKKPETNGCSELREGMLIRAIGENNILDAIPYVIWKLRSSRSILVLRDSIRSLGLLGYKDAFKDSIEAMRKRGLRLENKMDIEMVMSLVRIKTEGMRMKRYMFRRHDIFSRIDMQYGGRLIDALADTYTRNVIGYHSSPSVNLVSMSTKKGKIYIIIFENRSQCYLEPGKYYYTERVYVNGKEYDPHYYTIFDILMPPYYRPFQLVYWETYIPKELISAGDEVKVSICNYKYFSNVIRIR